MSYVFTYVILLFIFHVLVKEKKLYMFSSTQTFFFLYTPTLDFIYVYYLCVYEYFFRMHEYIFLCTCTYIPLVFMDTSFVCLDTLLSVHKHSALCILKFYM